MQIKTCGRCLLTLPRSGFYANRAMRDGLQGNCKECTKESSRASKAKARLADPEGYAAKKKAENQATRQKHGEKYKPRKLAYQRANVEKNRAWAKKGRDKKKAENPSEYRAFVSEKVSRRLAGHASPSWLSVADCRSVYRYREYLITSTGVSHHVDHEVPLNGELVCGLHVHENLRVLTAAENQAKGNTFDPVTFDWWPACCPRPDSRQID